MYCKSLVVIPPGQWPCSRTGTLPNVVEGGMLKYLYLSVFDCVIVREIKHFTEYLFVSLR